MGDNSSITRNSSSGGAEVATVSRGNKHFQSVEGNPITRKHFVQFFTLAGDGTGQHRVIGDYSGASTEEWTITPGTDEVIVVTNIRMLIADGSALSTAAWGNLGVLSNGIGLRKADGTGTITDIFAGQGPITTLGSLQRYMTIDDNLTGALAWSGSHVATFEYPLIERFGGGLRLSDADGEFLGINLDDDFTGLDDMTTLAIGYYEDDGT